MKENIGFINIKLLKYKDVALVVFENYKTLQKKQFGCQLKVLHTDKRRKYIKEFNDYFQENNITHKTTISYSLE